MSHIKDKWVIIFLIYADFRANVNNIPKNALSMTEQMKAELNSMFKDILKVPLDPERARMFVIMNSIYYKQGDGLITETKTLFYEIGKPDGLSNNQIVCWDVIGEPDPANPLQNPDLLKEILKERIHVHESEQVFFITWDHGSAFGIFREVDPGVANLQTPIYHNLERYPYLSEFWNKALDKDPNLKKLANPENDLASLSLIQIGNALFSVDATPTELSFLKHPIFTTQTMLPIRFETQSDNTQNLLLVFDSTTDAFEVLEGNLLNNKIHTKIGNLKANSVREILSNDELASVFQFWLGADKKVGVLLMMNCWMMNMHTMYSLVDNVHCLVAPQSNIGTPGYNYKAILQYIFKNKALSISSQKLAVRCVKTVETKLMRRRSKKLREDQLDVIDQWKVFAFDLQTKDIDGKNLLVKQVEALENLINVMNGVFCNCNSSSEAKWMYKYIRSVCFDFSERVVMMIDIINWCLSLLSAENNFVKESGKSKLDENVIDELINFRKIALRIKPKPTLELCSTRGHSVYVVNRDVSDPTAVITIEPKGYSFFFPLFEIHSNPSHSGLLDNVKKDKLLNHLKNWKQFLVYHIDKEINY